MNRRLILYAVAGTLAFTVAAAFEADAQPLALVRLGLCGGALGLATAVDLAEHRVPNRVVLPAAGACAALSIAAGAALAVLGVGLAVVAVLLALSLVQPAALGMGDVKLALLVVLGLDGSAPRALLLGLSLAALAALLLLARRGRRAWRQALPLAPFFAAGALVALLL